ncbi:unnamed protein product [Schistosoma spindalis]|nr:unnamed protein product [Schistosoma spindale]
MKVPPAPPLCLAAINIKSVTQKHSIHSEVQPQISWCQIDYEVIWRSGSGCPITKLSTVIESQKLSSDNTLDLMKVPPAPPLCLAAINIKSVTQKHSIHSEVQPQISWCQIDYEVIWRSGSGCPITKLSTVIESQKLSSDNTLDLMKVPPAPPLCLAAINIKSVTQKHSIHSEVQPQISWCQIDYEVIWRSGSGCPITKLSTVIESQKLSSDNTLDLMKVPPAPPLCLAAINIKSVTQKHSIHSETQDTCSSHILKHALLVFLALFVYISTVKYLSKSPMTSNINHTNEQLPCTENYSELKEVLKPCGKLPPTNDIKLDRSHFKRKVPMIFVGIQCDKHVKTSLEKLKPFFCPFIRLPKISKTYLMNLSNPTFDM